MKMHARPMAIALGALSSVACGVRRGFSIGHLGLPGGLTAQRAPSACNRGAGLGVLAGGGGVGGGYRGRITENTAVTGDLDFGVITENYGRFGFRTVTEMHNQAWLLVTATAEPEFRIPPEPGISGIPVILAGTRNFRCSGALQPP
jgi:hypothetical protein